MQLDASDYMGPLVVTALYTLLYYFFQIRILRVKTRLSAEYQERGEKFDRYFSQDREMLAADRTQLNMLEHMPVFLTLLWVNALLVSALEATIAGAIYLAARALYPVVMGGRLGRGVRASIGLSTAPGYLVIAWLAVRPIVAALG